MVEIGGINDCDTAGLERLGATLGSRANTLIDLGDQLGGIKLIDGWVGDTSEVARRAFDAVVDDLTDCLRNDRPQWIGDLDGIPAAERSGANLAQLDFDRSSNNGQINEAQARFDQTGSAMDEKRWQLALDKRASLDAVERLMFQTGESGDFLLDSGGHRIAVPDRHLLAFDVLADHTLATAVIASGNIDTADHVSVHTPGFTSTVRGGLENLAGDVRRIRELS